MKYLSIVRNFKLFILFLVIKGVLPVYAGSIYLLDYLPDEKTLQSLCKNRDFVVSHVKSEGEQGVYYVSYCKGLKLIHETKKYDSSLSEYDNFHKKMQSLSDSFEGSFVAYEGDQINMVRGMVNYFVSEQGGLIQNTDNSISQISCRDKCKIYNDNTINKLGTLDTMGKVTQYTCETKGAENSYCLVNHVAPGVWQPSAPDSCVKTKSGNITCTINKAHYENFSDFFTWKLGKHSVRIVYEAENPARIYSSQASVITPFYKCDNIGDITRENYQSCDFSFMLEL
ncbi:MAG: hypothetical protein OXE99_09230 [Cellvibrionales bacterium]|nr:hypothetical protein [Cellvibrionales bacterium]